MTAIAETLSTLAIKGVSGPATNALTLWGRRKWDKFIALYTNNLSEYVLESISQCQSVKNMLYKSQMAPTDEKYVNVAFAKGRKDITDNGIVSGITSGRKFMIRGTGGAGKTMFTKWAVLRIVETLENHQKIPIFIALRDIDAEKKFDNFESYVYDRISNSRTKTTFNQFIEGLQAGIFILILDALDEVKKDKRRDFIKFINRFVSLFPDVGIVLTTREFPELDGSVGFEQVQTKFLTKEQALQILEKLDYNESTKNLLYNEIKLGGYESHSLFLQNPLMVTILLLTFDQSKDIPTKKSAFYKRAFEALYERHDGSKEGSFSRDHHAGLPMDEFEKIFSTFCYGSYIHSIYSFTDSQLVHCMKESALQCGIDEDPNLIARDCIESACLLVKEGHDNLFVHRSFQEYFVALFVKNYKDSDLSDIIREVLVAGRGESTLEFIYEMDKDSLERQFIIPLIKEQCRSYENYRESNAENAVKILDTIFSEITIHRHTGQFRSLHFNKMIDTIFFNGLGEFYPEINIFRTLDAKGNFPTNIAQNWPLDEISLLETTKIEKDSSGEEFISLKFLPDSIPWISKTNLPDNVKIFVDDIFILFDRLNSRLSQEKSPVMSRFSGFSVSN